MFGWVPASKLYIAKWVPANKTLIAVRVPENDVMCQISKVLFV